MLAFCTRTSYLETYQLSETSSSSWHTSLSCATGVVQIKTLQGLEFTLVIEALLSFAFSLHDKQLTPLMIPELALWQCKFHRENSRNHAS